MTFDGTCERGGVQRAPQEIEERSPGIIHYTLYTTIAFRTKKLAPENMATCTFHDANRAPENLQQETTGAREITKFEKAQGIIARAGELLQHIIGLTDGIDTITREGEIALESGQEARSSVVKTPRC
jgi:hypothetical protein